MNGDVYFKEVKYEIIYEIPRGIFFVAHII